MRKLLIAGIEIEAHPKRYDTYPVVTLFKLGASDSRSVLTPNEARDIAKFLVLAADAAEEE